LDALLQYPVEDLARRAAIILLSSEERYRVPEVATLVSMHESSVRYWIHRFNEEGMPVLRPDEASGRGSRIDPDLRDTLVELAITPPRQLGLKFTTWTLRELQGYLVDQEIVDTISHETIRQILKDEEVDWQTSGCLPKDAPIPELLEKLDTSSTHPQASRGNQT
jgi:transposase